MINWILKHTKYRKQFRDINEFKELLNESKELLKETEGTTPDAYFDATEQEIDTLSSLILEGKLGVKGLSIKLCQMTLHLMMVVKNSAPELEVKPSFTVVDQE